MTTRDIERVFFVVVVVYLQHCPTFLEYLRKLHFVLQPATGTVRSYPSNISTLCFLPSDHLNNRVSPKDRAPYLKQEGSEGFAKNNNALPLYLFQ